MAQRTVVHLIDDLDGSVIADGDGETVQLTYRGQSYELDLSSGNADRLDRALEQYLAVARKTSRQAAPPGRGATSRAPVTGSGGTGGLDPKAVRAWAADNNVAVNSRGRLSAEVVEQYRAANP